jgi:hypothetical protein
LTGLVQLQQLGFFSTPITDEGLEHLKAMTQLKHLTLGGTMATTDRIRDLKKELPGCRIAP